MDVWSYSGLIKGFVQGKQLDTALQVLTEMRSAGVRPNEVKTPHLLQTFMYTQPVALKHNKRSLLNSADGV